MAARRLDGTPIPAPAPYRNLPIRGRTDPVTHRPWMLCDEYRNKGGAQPCPSGASPQQYANAMKTFTEWVSAWSGANGVKAKVHDPQCAIVRPTWTPTRTSTRTATSPPVVIATATRTPTPGPNPYAKWVEALAAHNVTAGCGSDAQGRKLFCPDRDLTRAEAAVWIVNALQWQLEACKQTFADVPCQ